MRDEPTVFIIDDDEDMRASLHWLMESAGMRAEAFASGEAFLAACVTQRPGCVILDIRMPGMDGPALFDRLRAQGCALPVIILTGYGDIRTAVRLVKCGAFDFVEKPFAEGEIVEKTRQGLNRSILLLARARERAQAQARLMLLTVREREVLERVVRGHANKVIAIDLGISEKTVETHRAHLMRKMGARTFADLMKMTLALQEDQGNPL